MDLLVIKDNDLADIHCCNSWLQLRYLQSTVNYSGKTVYYTGIYLYRVAISSWIRFELLTPTPSPVRLKSFSVGWQSYVNTYFSCIISQYTNDLYILTEVKWYLVFVCNILIIQYYQVYVCIFGNSENMLLYVVK